MCVVNVIINNKYGNVFFLSLLTFWYLCVSSNQVQASIESGASAEVKVVAILSKDEFGKGFTYPSFLGYDKDMDELYVVVGGRGKTIVYNSNFFPTVSLGAGRGADAAQGIYIHDDGMIYLCQGRTEERPGRLTIFNQAFFPVKQITFDSIPGTEDFRPRKVVVGLTGNIYVVGLEKRGVLVLDKEGNYSHWLKPQDEISETAAAQIAREKKEQDRNKPELNEAGRLIQEDVESEEEQNMTSFLPPELIPKTKSSGYIEKKKTIGPVKIIDITRDSEGHLYVLSEETSKVYVFSPFEKFLFSFGEKGGASGKMSRPKSLVVDEKKKAVYIVDYMRHTILIFDLSGRFMYEFGGLGTGPGWFQYPTGLTLNREGLLAVADLFNNRVQILEVQFEYKFPLFKPTDMNRPELKDDEDSQDPSDLPERETEDEDILQPLPL